MQAVILAGGKGTRLKPYTTILPKPLMPIGEKAILEIVLLQLKKAGFKELIFTVGYLGELIEAYFGDGNKWGVKIRYSRENEPLGTAGPLTLIENLDPQFLVMNGDILCNLDYSDFMQKHLKDKRDISICCYSKDVKINLGILEFEGERLKDYIEKPVHRFKAGMGIYAVARSMVEKMPRAQYYDFPNLIRDRIKAGSEIGVFHFSDHWYDIGAVEDYQSAQDKFGNDPSIFIIK